MMLSLLAFIVLATAALVQSQRPSFAGTRPIGYPEITSTEGLADRFGEVDGTTQRLPVEANGDRGLMDRLSKLPIDKQPFWFINWQALEAHRQNPQTYPQKPNTFVDPPQNNGNSNFGNINSGNTGNVGNPNAGNAGNSNFGNAGSSSLSHLNSGSSFGVASSNAANVNSNTGNRNSVSSDSGNENASNLINNGSFALENRFGVIAPKDSTDPYHGGIEPNQFEKYQNEYIHLGSGRSNSKPGNTINVNPKQKSLALQNWK